MNDVIVKDVDALFFEILNQQKGTLQPSKEVINQYYADDVYVREMVAPANSFLLGRIHKYSCVSFMLEGSMRIWSTEYGSDARIVSAPNIFVSKAGIRRAVHTLTKVRFATANGTGKIPDWVTVDNIEEPLRLLSCDTRKEYNQFLETRGQYGQIQDLRA